VHKPVIPSPDPPPPPTVGLMPSLEKDEELVLVPLPWPGIPGACPDPVALTKAFLTAKTPGV